MSIEKLNLASPDLTANTLVQLKALAPQAFNLDGALNPDKLKEAIGAEVVVERERFGLNWPGKQDALRAAAKPTSATLRPEAGKSVNFDTTGNVIIEGDNLETLKVLQRAYHGKIKMIYIDPPYNTGKDFVYPDDYAEPLKAYLERTGQKDEAGFWTSSNGEASGRKHSNWLSMMAPRLMLARNLLREDGVIFVSIDDNEVHRLRMLMDEVFGEENFVGLLPTVMNLKGNNDEFAFAGTHEYTVVYSKSKEACSVFEWPLDEEDAEEWEVDERGSFKQGAGLKSTGVNAPRAKRPNLWFPVFLDASGVAYVSDDDKPKEPNHTALWPMVGDQEMSWRWGKKKFQNQAYDVIVSGEGKNATLYKKQRPSLGDIPSKKPKSVLYKPEYSSGNGTAECKELLGFKGFSNPKPLQLLQDLILVGATKDSLILDFFAGSGTTAHAVMNLNAQDGGARKFILVQIPEPVAADSSAAKADFKTIADITRKRIKQAGAKLTAGAGLMAQNLDTGFRSFRLDSSNFREWNKTATPSDLLSQIAAHSDSTLSGRTEQDLLYEVLVKAGFSPATPVESFFVNSQACFGIHDRQWVLCLEAQVKLETLEAIAALDLAPARVICLDGGFANDAAKANAAVFYRQKNIELRTV